MIELKLKFDQARKTFTSRDVLTGEAAISCSRNTTVTSIKLSCIGMGHVTSTQTGGKPAEETYWHSDSTLFEPENGSEKLTSGTHKYKFSFQLPDDYFPALPASFAYKRDASGNGIKWLVRLQISYPKIKLRRTQSVEKPFVFFPQYNPKKFTHAIPFVTYEFERQFKGNTHQYVKPDKVGLRSKLKASMFGSSNDTTKKEVTVFCNLIIAKQGVSQAPFSSGINLQLWSSQSNFVLLEEIVLTLCATQNLKYASVTEESKFRAEIARLTPEGGEVLPGNKADPITLTQLIKAHTNGPFVIQRSLPGTFDSKYFAQSYVLKVELKIASFYNRKAQATLTFEEPVEVLHIWVCPDANTIPSATFLQSLDAQLGLEGFDDEDGLPAYDSHDGPPDFAFEDITPVVSPMMGDSSSTPNLAPLTALYPPSVSNIPHLEQSS